MKNILFVCSGNSCRSQIAEGFGNTLSNGEFNVTSAGITPIGVHPMAIETMRDVGIDISEQTSDLLDTAIIDTASYVITLCNQARDNCPVIPPSVNHIHWDINNPDRLYFSEEDRHNAFAKIRDELKERIEELFSDIS